VNINVCVFAIQLEQSNVYLYALNECEFLLSIVDKEQHFLELLKTSSNKKFWAFSFLQYSLNNPMYTMYLLYVFERLKVFLCIINEEHNFQELLWELQVMKSFEHFHFKWILWSFLCLLPMLICCSWFCFSIV
jgi:hypothetical protein